MKLFWGKITSNLRELLQCGSIHINRCAFIYEKVFYADVQTLANTFAGNHQMPRNVKVNSTGLVTSGIYSGWTLAPQLSSPPTPICSPIARMTV